MCVRDADDRCVLQFTLRNAAGCALHRRASRVIHRSELFVAPTGRREFCFTRAAHGRQCRRRRGPRRGPGFSWVWYIGRRSAEGRLARPARLARTSRDGDPGSERFPRVDRHYSAGLTCAREAISTSSVLRPTELPASRGHTAPHRVVRVCRCYVVILECVLRRARDCAALARKPLMAFKLGWPLSPAARKLLTSDQSGMTGRSASKTLAAIEWHTCAMAGALNAFKRSLGFRRRSHPLLRST